MAIPSEYGIDLGFSGDLQRNACILLQSRGYDRVYQHSCRVAEEAVSLARRFGADEEKAKAAALLHDIGVVVPDGKRDEFLSRFGIKMFREEAIFPLILHQRISRILAKDLFHIEDFDILDAIECHTTLKARATKLDITLFVADKLRWDQNGIPPYYGGVVSALMVSLEHGALSYIEYLLENKASLKVIHPWLLAAFDDLRLGYYSSL